MNTKSPLQITPSLAQKLIKNQFPEFAHLDIQSVTVTVKLVVALLI